MTTKVIKRDGTEVAFSMSKIRIAIEKALCETNMDPSLACDLCDKVCSRLVGNITVEECQDVVVEELVKANYVITAQAYTDYRKKRTALRVQSKSEEWKKQCEEAVSHFPTVYNYIVYLRTYSKFLEDKGRRETWVETCERFTSFMKEIMQDKLSEEEYTEIHNAILNREVLPSMRMLQFAGEAIRRNNICAYNCAYTSCNRIEAFRDALMILMSGSGIGFSVESKYVNMLPVIKKQSGEILPVHVIDDSREGWCEAFYAGLKSWYDGKDIPFDYSKIRPAGARLKISGGRASGPDPLKNLFVYTRELILSNQGGKLSTINVYDLMCKIGIIVLCGGVRRCISENSRVLTRFGSFKAIQNIKVGDQVMTDNGWKPVLNVFEQGEQEVIKIKHTNGYLECTPNHRMAVLTDAYGNFEWKEAGKLCKNDVLVFPTLNRDEDTITECKIGNLQDEQSSKVIPQCIKNASTNIKAAYLQGLPDAHMDEEFTRDIQNLYYSMNIVSRVVQVKDKWTIEVSRDRGNGKFSPVNILEILRENKVVLTYDIEVEDNHCFVCEGVLTHNSSEISLSDISDITMRDAKKGAFWNEYPDRVMANNSAVYNTTPTDEELESEWKALIASGSGERGIISRSHLIQQLPKRRIEMLGDEILDIGGNPCMEIFLLPNEFCNLTTVSIVPEDREASLLRKVRLATIIGTFQSTLTKFPIISPEWKVNAERERLLGVCLTGMRDCKYLDHNLHILDNMRETAVEVNAYYADRFGINRSTAITAVKPSGTSGEMLGTASGIHARFAPYYIRRIRISATDPLAKLLIDQGVPYNPETGQLKESANTWVFEFPQKSPENSTMISDLSAIDQLNYWKEVKNRYTEHNPSTTIHVKSHEWDLVLQWLKDNWSIVGGLSFLPYDDHVYKLAPYEAISKEVYEQKVNEFPSIDFSKLILYEKSDTTERKKVWACIGDRCSLE